MGRVYLARRVHESPEGREDGFVAVKLIRADADQRDEFRRRFAREAAAARRVNGSFTARVLDTDFETEVPWVATEYVPGPTLHAVVRSDFGPLPAASVHILAHRLGLALQAIHTAGLVHRDLKPSNILLTVDGPRVIDFGIAHVVNGTLDSTITRTGSVVGTPEFMSPEQVRGLRVTPASDVFSLGSVLVYAATGRSPFRGEAEDGVHAVMFRIAYEAPDLTGLPEAVSELVHNCLARDPEDRPTLAELLGATRRAPAGAWLPPVLLNRLDRVAARPLPDAPHRRRAEPPPSPDDPESPGVPDFPEHSGPFGLRDPLDLPDAGIAPPSVRRAPPSQSLRVRRRLTALVVAVGAMLSVLAGTWVAIPALNVWLGEGAAAQGSTGMGQGNGEEGTDNFELYAYEWEARVEGHDGDSPLLLHLQFRHYTEPYYVAASDKAVCTGRFLSWSASPLAAELAEPTSKVILPKGAPRSRCPAVGRVKVVMVDERARWHYAPGHVIDMQLVTSRLGSPIPRNFLGTRRSGTRTVTVSPGDIGRPTVTGVDETEGRRCVWSAVVLRVEKSLTTSPPVLDASRSASGCTAPTEPYTYRPN
jgi:serine/threonine protein kinase